MLDLAAELIDRLRQGGLRELEVRQGGIRVKVSTDARPAAALTESDTPAPAVAVAVPERPAAGARTQAKTVTAPLTGIFYRSASPQADPFVQLGSVVSAGDVIGFIEAMKLFNEVRSTVAGRVRRIEAENGQLVRAHQVLIEVE